MKLIGKPEKFDASRPRIDRFHRIALGLETGTRVHLSQLPSLNHTEIRPGELQHSEILLTTFHPEQWGDLWRVSMELEEGEGLVAEVLELLREINIGIIETLTTENRRSHEILAVFDASMYSDSIDKTTEERAADPNATMAGLQRKLLEGLPGGRKYHKEPSINRLNRLHEAYLRLKTTNVRPVIADIIHGRIKYDMEEFRQLLFPDSLPVYHSNFPQRVMMFSDTEEKYLSMYFPKKEDILLNISISHREQSGAILDFTSKLREVRANILSSYSRLQHTGDIAQWKTTLEMSNVESCSKVIETTAKCRYFREFDEFEVSYLPQLDRKQDRLPPNPYKYTSGLKKESMFVGREDLIRKIANRVQDNFLISGYSKTGKTSLLERLESEFNQTEETLVLKVRAIESSFWLDILKVAYRNLPNRTKDEVLRPQFSSVLNHIEAGNLNGVIEHFEALWEHTKQAGLKRIAILVDEAQDILSLPSDNQLHIEWVRILDLIKDICWVVVSRDHWRGEAAGPTPVKAKLQIETLEPLSEEAANQLIILPFEEVNIKVDNKAVRRIKHLTNLQGIYIQALCLSIYDDLNQSPDKIDVVTTGMVDKALRETFKHLQEHFSQLAKDLKDLFEPTSLERLIRDNIPVTMAEVLKKDIINKDAQNYLDLSVVPGVVITESDYMMADGDRMRLSGFGRTIKLNEMFRLWRRQKVRSTAIEYNNQ
jgi:hypothetical protein